MALLSEAAGLVGRVADDGAQGFLMGRAILSTTHTHDAKRVSKPRTGRLTLSLDMPAYFRRGPAGRWWLQNHFEIWLQVEVVVLQ